MPTPESIVKKSIVAYLSFIPNCEIFPVSTVGVYDAAQKRFRKSVGRIGTPDLLLCYRGVFVGIEVKSKTGRLTDEQKEIGACIESAGGVWGVAKSMEDVREILKRADLVTAPLLTKIK